MKCSLLAVLTLAPLAAAPAFGQAHIVSRLSTASASHDDGGPFSWSESDSFTGEGTADITLPHRFRHSFVVTPTRFAGTFDGYYSVESRTEDRTASSLDTVFTVGLRTAITVGLNGSLYPASGPREAAPIQNNAYFHIVRTSPGPATVVFDSFTDGHPSPIDENHVQAWANTVWNGVLTAGTYHVIGGAHGVWVEQSGPGRASGSGHLTVDLTLTPACPADFNHDGFLDQFDYAAFVDCFESGACDGGSSDFNGDGFADFFDYADFVAAFETGC